MCSRVSLDANGKSRANSVEQTRSRYLLASGVGFMRASETKQHLITITRTATVFPVQDPMPARDAINSYGAGEPGETETKRSVPPPPVLSHTSLYMGLKFHTTKYGHGRAPFPLQQCFWGMAAGRSLHAMSAADRSRSQDGTVGSPVPWARLPDESSRVTDVAHRGSQRGPV
ncbi:hypothetical protein AAFF_G00283840 [Aldrovandia affinis]|uniref:Uncharacterized protein n=1 Tax=Aldrovandia affinis TaxID=143900 RepID=A0AAD7TAQ4_9TELE|nr:hypothetical protein AAFF_G00283840 [Aldrovandia affinis]